MTKIICNQCGGVYDDGGNYDKARMKPPVREDIKNI